VVFHTLSGDELVVSFAGVLKEDHEDFPNLHDVGITLLTEGASHLSQELVEANCMHKKGLINTVDIFLAHPLSLYIEVLSEIY
jgi:hypothetical protein